MKVGRVRALELKAFDGLRLRAEHRPHLPGALADDPAVDDLDPRIVRAGHEVVAVGGLVAYSEVRAFGRYRGEVVAHDEHPLLNRPGARVGDVLVGRRGGFLHREAQKL